MLHSRHLNFSSVFGNKQGNANMADATPSSVSVTASPATITAATTTTPAWNGTSLKQRCECHHCLRSGATTHNDDVNNSTLIAFFLILLEHEDAMIFCDIK
jgi:hypothetical protein